MINMEYVGRDTLEISIGSVRVARFQINNRYQANNSRRPRNLAVYVSVSPIARPDYPNYGNSVSIGEALELLRKMELDTQKFIEMCHEQGWREEVDKDQMRMF